MKKVIFSLIIIIYASMFLFVYAENIPGKNISLIKCQKNPSETYYCYLPSLYNGKEPLPVLYCFSPTGNGKSLVQVYQKVCEEVGWIIIGVNVSSRNSAPGG
ncbi:MAG: hypothetical protein KAI63_01585, partial [Planctomycetes bacterium]|nr:hypothetical protein [Planctomycetota bacterium]